MSDWKSDTVTRDKYWDAISEADREMIFTLMEKYGPVMFRSGFLVCREYMARFVEAESPEIAASIRANWHPKLDADPGKPRPHLRWDEVADGGEEGPWTPKDTSPSLKALPYAYRFMVALGIEEWQVKP